MLQMIHVFGCA